MDKDKLIKLNERQEKWRKMIELKDFSKKTSKLDSLFKRRVRKGIPSGIRQKVWPLLASVDQFQKSAQFDYNELVETKDFPYKNDISVDLPRTFPNHMLFKGQDSVGIQSLNNILKALSLTFKEMGYCQGLNFIGASLLMYMNDEEAYWMLYSLMQKYECLPIYQNVGNIYIKLYAFDKLLGKFLPKVLQQLSKFNIQSVLYATPWFMTLYSSVLPFNLFLRTFDIFLLEKWKIIYRVGLTILKHHEAAILRAQGFDEIMVALKNIDVFAEMDEDQFFSTANNQFIFSKKKILKYELEFKNKNPISNTENKPNK